MSFLVACAQARKEKQYNAAVTAMVQAAKISGAYVERTEQAIDWTGNMEDLKEAQVERLMEFFERLVWGEDKAKIEAARRRAGLLIEGSATEIDPQAESR